jgi:tetratricopeptide (TPR) repeat protein
MHPCSNRHCKPATASSAASPSSKPSASSVLLAEYLRALVAEKVLDLATADLASDAYNRVRYSAAGDDDPQVSEAATALYPVAERLAAMSREDRQQLAARISARIQSTPTEQTWDQETEHPTAAQKTTVPAARSTRAARHSDAPRSSVEKATRSLELADPLDAPEGSTPAGNARRAPRPRVRVELAAVAALVTFFGGYLFRDSANEVGRLGDDIENGPNQLSARDAWKNTELWVHGIRFRAEEEARARRFGKARLALELALAYEPGASSLLNDLAALYLAPDETGATNPKRALELAERALEYTRQPVVLDTAAEAYFQCGYIREAIELEAESLAHASQSGGEDEEQAFRKHREKQLKKFQDADQVRTAQNRVLPGEFGPTVRGPAKSRIRGPLASRSSEKPAGS